MRGRRQYHSNTGFLDLLFNGWLIYVMLFVVSFMLIVPERDQANIKTKAEFVITLTWDDASTDDIDIWVEDPTGALICYKHKEAGLTHLDRDDLGTSTDKVTLPSGKIVEYKHNQEIVTIRGFMPGEWVINIHMYNKRDKKPVGVEVRMLKLNPTIKEIFMYKCEMSTRWEEITVARIQMSADGEILSMNNVYKKLIKTGGGGTMTTGEDGHQGSVQ